MAYVSLFRKYRPQTFEDVIGQEHITRTLQNAIREGRIASGYLFCGTRGTAKTTCARVLAKALNCIGPDGTLTTPTPEPCGVCGPCKAIAASSFVDVIEMDAASNRSIDDIRDLIDSVKFPPMEGRYKVTILDEAHQLTDQAKDAFLKTLEEPPPNVLFILATTDQHKMPITIQSRCQVFEFKRGSVAQIAQRLNEVLAAEGVRAEPSAVTLIARAAEGSYRDSLSLLEQVLAYKRENITSADVSVVLGTVEEDVLERVVDLIAASDAAGAFALAGSILESGKDVRQFLKSLTGRFRDMMFVAVGAKPQESGEMDDSAALRAQAARFAPAALLHGMDALAEADREMRSNTQHRLLLEMTLLRLMRLPSASAVIAAAPLPAALPKAPAPAPAHPPSAAPLPAGAPPPLIVAEEQEEGEDERGDSLIVTDADELDDLPPVPNAEPEEELLQVQQVAAAPAPVAATTQGFRDAPLREEPESEDDATLAHLGRSWQEVINRVSSVRPSAVSLVKDARPTALHGTVLTLDISNQFFVDRLNTNEAGRRMIEDQINRALGVPEGTYRVRGVLRGAHDGGEPPTRIAQGIARVRDASPRSAPEAPPAPSALDKLTDETVAVFGGRVEEDAIK